MAIQPSAGSNLNPIGIGAYSLDVGTGWTTGGWSDSACAGDTCLPTIDGDTTLTMTFSNSGSLQ